MLKRASNQELCAAFRALLTTGAEQAFLGDCELLDATKDWRNDLWKRFRAIEERMCMTPEIARRDGLGERK